MLSKMQNAGAPVHEIEAVSALFKAREVVAQRLAREAATISRRIIQDAPEHSAIIQTPSYGEMEAAGIVAPRGALGSSPKTHYDAIVDGIMAREPQEWMEWNVIGGNFYAPGTNA